MSHIWAGCRALALLDDLLQGRRDLDGVDAVTHAATFRRVCRTVYTDPYHNYFVPHGDDGFKLCLHPDVLPIAEARRDSELFKHLWFGHQSDPATLLSGAMVAKILDKAAARQPPAEGGNLDEERAADADDEDEEAAEAALGVAMARRAARHIAGLETATARRSFARELKTLLPADEAEPEATARSPKRVHDEDADAGPSAKRGRA